MRYSHDKCSFLRPEQTDNTANLLHLKRPAIITAVDRNPYSRQRFLENVNMIPALYLDLDHSPGMFLRQSSAQPTESQILDTRSLLLCSSCKLLNTT